MDLDTLRWGDNIAVQLTGTAAAVGISSASSQKQIAKTQWRWPIMWGVRFIVSVQTTDPNAPAFDVTFQVTIGSGQNSSTCEFTYTVTPAAGVYPIVTDFQQLPASDIQITGTVKSSVALAPGITSTVYLGAYVAPLTEPHGLTRLFEWMLPPPEGGQRWMQNYPPGGSPQNPGTGVAFPVDPDPLYYQRR
jgi:hypothetical protein